MTSSASFDDLVHQLLNVPRPKVGSEEQLKTLVSSVVSCCDNNDEKWKRVLLSLLYKRYHLLAPEAKAEASLGGQKKDVESPTSTAAGDGERLIFYTAIQTLLEQATSNDTATNTKDREQLVKAISVLCQLSPHVGGSRDVCKLMEIFAMHLLKEVEQASGFLAKESSESIKIAKATALIKSTLESSGDTGPYAGLAWLLDYTSGQIGKDLDLVNQDKNAKDGKKVLPSTLNVFVPHNKRGKSNKKGKTETSMRKIVNASLEILIWSKSDAAMKNPAFAKSLETFCDPGITANGDKAPIKSALMTMQTVIRKLRLSLNNFAREEGFMLTDLFLKDENSIQVKHIRHAKSADLSKMTSLATKKKSTATLRMIQVHFASDPSKITKYDSVTEIIQAFGGSNSNPSATEIEKLERHIQVARLGATIKHLREVRNESDDDNQNRVIASVDRASADAGNLNHVAAVMVAAAMGEWPMEVQGEKTSDIGVEEKKGEEKELRYKLILGKSEQQIDSFQNAVDLLDGLLGGSLKIDIDGETFVGGEGTDDSVATTKTVMNLIERHVARSEQGTSKPNANLILFTSAGIRIPQDTQSAFTSAGFRIHCHDSDGLGERLKREKARTGDITISLAWDTYDDLDLHVILPYKEEIYYGNKKSSNGNACLDVDMNAGGARSKEPVENVFLGDIDKKIEADHGSYKVFVQNYAYHTNDRSAEIPWRVVIDKNGKKENFVGKCQGSGKASNQVVAEFNYAERTVPFPGEEKDSFATANLVSLTTSTGQTMESVSQLLGVLKDLEKLNEVRVLAEMDDDSDEEGCMPHGEEEEACGGYESDSIEDGSWDEEEEAEAPRPTQANVGTLEVTSRDLLDMKLAKLPKRFQLAVSDAFGGVSLVEMCAEKLARKLIAEKMPLKVLSDNGYPKELVNAVKSKLAFAASANHGDY